MTTPILSYNGSFTPRFVGNVASNTTAATNAATPTLAGGHVNAANTLAATRQAGPSRNAYAGSYSPSQATGHSNVNLRQSATPTMAANTRSVNNNSLVSNRLNAILSQSSPYLSLARTRAQQAGNARGLLNSSMTAGAGEAAAIAAAAPLAQQEAQTYQKQDLANQGYLNQAASQNAQIGANVNIANTSDANAMGKYNAAAVDAINASNTNASNQSKQSNAISSTNVSLANSAQGNALNQNNAALASRTAMQNAANANRTAQFNAQQKDNLNIANAKLANQASQFNAQQANSVGLQNAASTNKTAQFNAQQGNAVAQLNQAAELNIRNDNVKTDIRRMINANSQLLQKSQSASSIIQGTMNAISGIYGGSSTDVTKNTATRNIIATTNNALGVSQAAYSNSHIGAYRSTL